VFKRVSLAGSAELFKETTSTAELLPEPETMPAPIHPLPLSTDGTVYFQYALTEAQVQALVDAVQKLKYPHTLKTATKLSMEEFERLEALRQVLLDGLK
jgi:hypothetical protein